MTAEEENKKNTRQDKQRLIESGKQLLNTIYEEEVSDDIELESGECYLFKEQKPEEGLKLSLHRMEEEGNGYVLTRLSPKKIKKRYGASEEIAQLYWLTKLDGDRNFDPVDLPLIAHSIINFVEKSGGLIFIEGVETLLKHNSFDRFLSFLDNLVDVVEVEEGILILSLDPRTISEQRLAQIERKLNIIS